MGNIKRAAAAAFALVLFSTERVAAQAPPPVTIVRAGRLLDPRTGNVLSSATVLSSLAELPRD